jgi:DNA-binding transcriptional LysR family regulator
MVQRADPSWDDYRTVLAIAETRSLSGAAHRLAVNQSTIFRRLGALEERIGTRLFDRQRSGYSTTTAGEEMVELARRMGDEITEFERRLTGLDRRPQGLLRLATNDTFLVHLLPDILARFRKDYPGIIIEVLVGNQSLNLAKREADVAIRATSSPPETLVGRRLAANHWGVYGRKGTGPLSRDCYREYDWVGFSPGMGAPAIARWIEDNVGFDRVGLRVDTVIGIAEAVAAGAGLAILPCFIAKTVQQIEPVSEEVLNFGVGIWILTHPDIRNTARVRAFMDFAGNEIARLRPQIEGL